MFSLAQGRDCVSDLRLDALLAGEAAGAEARSIVAHLGGCGGCKARLSELERARQAFREELREEAWRAPARGQWWRRGPGRAALLTAAAAGICVIWLGLPRAVPVQDVRPERLKGSAHLGFFVVHDGSSRIGGPGEPVRPGDMLVFTVSTPAPAYVAVLSRDGAGQANIYYPAGRDAAAPIATARAEVLSPATLLDGTPGTEHLYGLFCTSAVRLEELRGALAATGELQAPPGCAVDAVSVEKVR